MIKYLVDHLLECFLRKTKIVEVTISDILQVKFAHMKRRRCQYCSVYGNKRTQTYLYSKLCL